MPRRAPLVPLVIALLATCAFAPRAEAVVISREGDQLVVRPDPDELLKDVEVTGNGSSFTIAKKYVVDEIGTPHSGPGCDATGAPPAPSATPRRSRSSSARATRRRWSRTPRSR